MNVRSCLLGALGPALLLLAGDGDRSWAQKTVDVRINRWLEIQQVSGSVSLELRNSSARAAQIGDRMSQVSDRITTGARSGAKLALDSGVGTVEVAENTLVQIQVIDPPLPDQGRVTRLIVPRGRVRLRLRHFTSPNSRLEIQTPAGVSGVRGTEFGVSVQPNGKTGTAVLDGRVANSAQNQSVDIDAQFQSLTMVGEPPQPPTPLKDDPGLDYQLERQIVGQRRQLILVGKIDPVNSLLINGVATDTDREGRFRLNVPMTSFPKVNLVVATPLGKEKTYDLAF
jgi:FecR protein